MKNKALSDLLAAIPAYIKEFNSLHGDLLVRVHDILTEKGISQNELAKRLDKRPSEISKWLSGGHNLTLMSVAKLQAELGEPLLYVPQKKDMNCMRDDKPMKFIVHKNIASESTEDDFELVENEDFELVDGLFTESEYKHAS